MLGTLYARYNHSAITVLLQYYVPQSLLQHCLHARQVVVSGLRESAKPAAHIAHSNAVPHRVVLCPLVARIEY